VSVQDLRPSSQATSNFYLANIYQTIADPNRLDIPPPSSPPPFSPPTYAVCVNSLWFLSLLISITCALLATLLQQWAREYLKVAQIRSNLRTRARMRAYFADGVEKSLLPWAVEALPALLHVSLFLFFAGLVVFLWNVNLTVFGLALSWVCCCTAFYGCITLIPVFRRNSPYYTPLTPLVRYFVLMILSGFRRALRTDWLQELVKVKTFEDLKKDADPPSKEKDRNIFVWTLDRLDEDHELERFFSGLPGFRHSSKIIDPLPNLDDHDKIMLHDKLMGFLKLTFSSDLLPDPVKSRRVIMCAKALDLGNFVQGSGDDFSRTVLHASYSEQQTTNSPPIADNGVATNAIFLQAMHTAMVARPQHRDDSWFSRHAKALGHPEVVLRHYAAKGNSLSLAILNYVARQQFNNYQFPSWPSEQFWDVLDGLSKFDARNTASELRDEFCTLWNQIVLKARNDDQKMAGRILSHIRDVYVTLHSHTHSAPTQPTVTTGDWDNIMRHPFSYPECNPASHVSDSSAFTPPARVVPATASPDAPSLSVPAPSPVDQSLTTVPPLDSSHPALRTIQTPHIPVTSRVPAPASKNVVVTSGLPTPLHTPETSMSATPRFFASPPATVSLQNNTHLLTPSDSPSLVSSPVLDNILPTGPLHSQLDLDSI
jgi:hypothetical protein